MLADLPLLFLTYGCGLLVIMLPRELASFVPVCGVASATVTAMAIVFKLKLKPSSVYLLTVAGVILNTFACGSGLPFKYAVVLSPIVSCCQAFLTLPLKI